MGTDMLSNYILLKKIMKITYTILLLLDLFTMLTASECRKTTTPEFYFKCKVDGQEYIPNSCANCRVAKLLGDTTFLLSGNRDLESILIGIVNHNSVPITINTYTLDQRSEQKASYKNSTSFLENYNTDSARTGRLIITTLDKTNKIVSGTFNFVGYNAVRNKTVNISEGSFRLNYKTD